MRYEKELKERVLKEVSESGNMSAVARKYELKVQTISSWVTAHKNRDQVGARAESRKLRRELDDALRKSSSSLCRTPGLSVSIR